MFIQKSPAATIEILARAILDLYKSDNAINVIGTRHGEKLYETLVNREDMIKAQDLGGYYRIPADNRDLNYNQFFSEGNGKLDELEEYHSHNTLRLNLEGMKALLLKLPLIRKDILQEEDVVYYPD